MEKRWIKRLHIGKLLLERHNDNIFRQRVECPVACLLADRADPGLRRKHRFEGRMFRTSGAPGICLLLEDLLQALRMPFGKVRLVEVQHRIEPQVETQHRLLTLETRIIFSNLRQKDSEVCLRTGFCPDKRTSRIPPGIVSNPYGLADRVLWPVWRL